MKTICTMTIGLGLLVLSTSVPVYAQEVPGEPTGLEIAVLVDELEDGDDQISEADWTLTNSKGKTRRRHTIRYWKDYDGKDELSSKSFMYFTFPPDVKDTTFLLFADENGL